MEVWIGMEVAFDVFDFAFKALQMVVDVVILYWIMRHAEYHLKKDTK